MDYLKTNKQLIVLLDIIILIKILNKNDSKPRTDVSDYEI